MTRIIKFRVWIPGQKRFAYPGEFNISNDGTLFDVSFIGSYKVNISLVIIQQFTHFFSREGEEIYEGDIIGFKKENRVLAPRYVEFKHGAFCAIPIGERPNFEDYFGMPGNCQGGGNPWSIVGNIYQNPELFNYD